MFLCDVLFLHSRQFMVVSLLWLKRLNAVLVHAVSSVTNGGRILIYLCGYVLGEGGEGR